MIAKSDDPRLAVLIDADNVPSQIATRLFEEIDKIGQTAVRRIYGDFSGTQLKAWAEIIPAHAVKAHQNFASTSHKNASDIALVIDAMDLLYTGRFEGFCLVSSDSDFTGLAMRIREQGIAVYGFSERKTPKSFRNACHKFIEIEKFHSNHIKPDKHPTNAIPLIKDAISKYANDDGWASLAQIGQVVKARDYGRAKLSNLVKETGCFELDSKSGKTLIHTKISNGKAESKISK